MSELDSFSNSQINTNLTSNTESTHDPESNTISNTVSNTESTHELGSNTESTHDPESNTISNTESNTELGSNDENMGSLRCSTNTNETIVSSCEFYRIDQMDPIKRQIHEILSDSSYDANILQAVVAGLQSRPLFKTAVLTSLKDDIEKIVDTKVAHIKSQNKTNSIWILIPSIFCAVMGVVYLVKK